MGIEIQVLTWDRHNNANVYQFDVGPWQGVLNKNIMW
jgi:hypothetical protein